MQSRPLIGSELPLVERLRKMKGMGDYQLAALMDGVGPQAADEIERLRSLLTAAQAREDKACADAAAFAALSLAAEAREEKLRQFHEFFRDNCEALFFHFGMEAVDLYNAAAVTPND